MGDAIWLNDRNGVRTPMQWNDSPSAGFTKVQPFAPLLSGDYSPKQVNVADQMADPYSLLHAIRRMVAIRKEHPAFGCGNFEPVDAGTGAIAGYTRSYQGKTMLILNNLSKEKQTAKPPFKAGIDAFTHESVPLDPVILEPYQYVWLILEP